MKFILFTLISLVSFIGFNNSEEMTHIKTISQPLHVQDKIQTKGMVSNCQPDNDQYCYLTEAVELILFGEKKNKTEIDRFLDLLLDNDTLDTVLQLGLQQLYLFARDNPVLLPGQIEKRIKINTIKRTICSFFQVILISSCKIYIE
jgi:hypothetical protein